MHIPFLCFLYKSVPFKTLTVYQKKIRCNMRIFCIKIEVTAWKTGLISKDAATSILWYTI